MPLFQSSGGTAEDRRHEATRIINIIMDTAEGMLTQWEQDFIEKYEHESMDVSPKVLFKLRDINSKYS
jgi:hypothetical protein